MQSRTLWLTVWTSRAELQRSRVSAETIHERRVAREDLDDGPRAARAGARKAPTFPGARTGEVKRSAGKRAASAQRWTKTR